VTLADRIVELAGIPAPTFAEGARLDWVERQLEAAPGRRYRDEGGNLIWRWGDDGPRLLVLAHVDTVFPGGTDLRFVRKGDTIVGPGIGDNAAAVVVTMDAVAELLGEHALAPGAVAFTVGEEGLGNLAGAKAACAALQPEVAVAVEGHGLERVIVDGVGSVRLQVTVTGPGGHSWVDRGQPSALHALLGLGAELVRGSTRELPVNIGLVSGGTSINTIASHAQLAVELRSLEEAALERFAASVTSLRVPEPLAIEVELLGRRPAGRLDRSHPLVLAVREVRAELGLPDEVGDGSTDANAAVALGIPALTIGVAFGNGMHSVDEQIDAASLTVGRSQVLGVLRRILRA
jgi:acetylornithine deacetylase/succinyl-diaminopimelate desuccinylase-like protein